MERESNGWAKQQRAYRKRGRLPLERERALNRIGFVWKVKEALWQKQYEDYRAFQTNPQAYDPKRKAALRSWLSVSRRRWHQLSPRKQRLLQEAGLVRQPFVENPKRVRKSFAVNNQERLQELEAFFARKGHLRGISQSLGKFVFRLRQRFQAGKLDPEDQKRYNHMGLNWFALNPAQQWSSFYARAAAYVQKCGSAVPPPLRWPDRRHHRWWRWCGHFGRSPGI